MYSIIREQLTESILEVGIKDAVSPFERASVPPIVTLHSTARAIFGASKLH